MEILGDIKISIFEIKNWGYEKEIDLLSVTQSIPNDN